MRRIVRIADDAAVPLILVSPVSNLQYAPFKSEHRATITTEDRERFDVLVQQAGEARAAGSSRALEFLQQAESIDDQYAQVHFEIGMRATRQARFFRARWRRRRFLRWTG